MLIPRSVLAARKCGDTNSSRYALGGLHFTRDAETQQPYAVATDGRKLVALTWQEPAADEYPAGENLHAGPQAETAVNGFTVPTAALDKVAACKIGAKSRKAILQHIAIQEPAAATDHTAPMMATDGDESARFEPRLQEGRFPRWRDVVPAPKSTDITFCCDARLLVQLLEAITAHTGSSDDPASVVLSLNRENTHSRPIVISAANASGKAVGILMPLELDERPANRWQAEAAEVEPAAVEPPAEIPAPEVAAPEVEPPPAPAVEPVDNRPIGRRPREIAAPAPSPPTLAEVLAATAGSDEPIADEPAPEWLTTTRELVAAGSRDNWEAGNY